jgi:hypothetical protein
MMRSCLLLLISAASLAQAEPPPRLEIQFAMTRNGSHMADVAERLEYKDGRYTLTETWKGKGIYSLLGSARRVSQGTIANGELRPIEFFDERTGRDTARAWFDWKAHTLTMQYKGNKRTEKMPPSPQDRLSFLLALSLLPGHADTVTYTVADGKGMSRHVYTVVARERIRLPAGEFNTVRVARHTDDRDTAELWLAAERGYVPVRLLVVEKDGTRYEQQAVRIAP